MSTQLQLDIDDTGVRYTARQWEILVHPATWVVDVDDPTGWVCDPITLTEFRRLYDRKKCGIRQGWRLDLTTLPIGQLVKIETLSQHLYTFAYRGTSDGSELAVIMDSINPWDGSTRETIDCNRWIQLGTGFVFGNKRSSPVIEYELGSRPRTASI